MKKIVLRYYNFQFIVSSLSHPCKNILEQYKTTYFESESIKFWNKQHN